MSKTPTEEKKNIEDKTSSSDDEQVDQVEKRDNFPVKPSSKTTRTPQKQYIPAKRTTRSESTESTEFFRINKSLKPEKITDSSRKNAKAVLFDQNRSDNLTEPSTSTGKGAHTQDTQFQFSPKNPLGPDSIPKTFDFTNIETQQELHEKLGKALSIEAEINIQQDKNTKLNNNTSNNSESNHTKTNSSTNMSDAITLQQVVSFKIPFFKGEVKELNGFINTCNMYDSLTPDNLKEHLLKIIKSRITGEALAKIQPIDNHKTCDDLMKELKKHLRKPISYEFANEEMNNIFQRSDENIESFGFRVRRCLRRINESSRDISDVEAERTAFRKTHEKLAISKFIQNIRNPEIRTLVAAANKTTLEACITFAMEKELLERNSNVRWCSICATSQHKNSDCPKKTNNRNYQQTNNQQSRNNQQNYDNRYRRNFPNTSYSSNNYNNSNRNINDGRDQQNQYQMRRDGQNRNYSGNNNTHTDYNNNYPRNSNNYQRYSNNYSNINSGQNYRPNNPQGYYGSNGNNGNNSGNNRNSEHNGNTNNGYNRNNTRNYSTNENQQHKNNQNARMINNIPNDNSDEELATLLQNTEEIDDSKNF